jgi:hypothetical protein
MACGAGSGQPGSGAAATRRLQHIRRVIRDLRDSPCLWPYGDHPGIREIAVEGYRILYEVDPDTGDNATAGDVTILRLFGPGMDRSSLK